MSRYLLVLLLDRGSKLWDKANTHHVKRWHLQYWFQRCILCRSEVISIPTFVQKHWTKWKCVLSLFYFSDQNAVLTCSLSFWHLLCKTLRFVVYDLMVSYFEIEVHQKCVGKDCCLMHVSITCILEKAQANAQVNLKMHFKLHINKIVLLKVEYSVYSVFTSSCSLL